MLDEHTDNRNDFLVFFALEGKKERKKERKKKERKIERKVKRKPL
jgi:hypothetical protein